jgi:rare lipoprotein A (peptidoglycan hydrolase)
MSSLSTHAVIPHLVIVAGIALLMSDSAASARERHGFATAKSHKQQTHVTHHQGAQHHLAGHQVTPHDTRRHVARGETAHEVTHSFSGVASYYSEGQRVASGASFNPSGYTCAHRTLPFGTHLRVADPRTGRSVVVTVNDRGPFVHGRVLDLSLGAARALGMIGHGVMHIDASVI